MEPEVDQRLRAFCPVISYFYTEALQNRGLLTSAVIGLTAGTVIGHLIEMKWVKVNMQYGNWY